MHAKRMDVENNKTVNKRCEINQLFFQHGIANTTYFHIYYICCKHIYNLYQQLLTHLEKHKVIKVFVSWKHLLSSRHWNVDRAML